MSLDTLKDTLKHEMSDLLSAEKQFAKLLEKVVKSADSDTVKQMAEEHHKQTIGQQENLQKAFEVLGEKPERLTCKAAQGLVEEATSTLKEEKPKGAIKDIVILGGSLRVEHYEIAGYTHAIAAAKALGLKEVAALLNENLQQEKETAKKITAAAPDLLKQAPADNAAADSQAAKPAAKKPAAKKGSQKGGAQKGASKAKAKR